MFLGLVQDFLPDKIYPLRQYNDRRNLIVDSRGPGLISNICPHQNSKLASRPADTLTCPYHGLKFDCAGHGINNRYSLEHWPVYSTQTMLFDRPVDDFPIRTDAMVLAEQREDPVQATVDIIMDVFLDIEHIPVAHPGVYDRVGITNIDHLTWTTKDNGSIQLVPAQTSDHMIDQDRAYDLGAVWMAVYPGTMIEWQPGALFVTVACPHDRGSMVQVYKYRDDRYDQHSWDRNNKVWEQAWQQDRDLAQGIVTLPQSNLTGLKSHHRRWLENVM